MNSTLERVAEALREGSVPFALIGAGAMAVHGVSRSTQDIDLLSTSSRCLNAAFWQKLTAAGVDVDIRAGDDDDPLLGVVRFAGQPSPVDLVLGRHAWQQGLLARAQPFDFAGVTIPVVSAADLILLKLYAGGVQDRWDIVQLLAAERPAVRDEVRAQISGLPQPAQELWLAIEQGRAP